MRKKEKQKMNYSLNQKEEINEDESVKQIALKAIPLVCEGRGRDPNIARIFPLPDSRTQPRGGDNCASWE